MLHCVQFNELTDSSESRNAPGDPHRLVRCADQTVPVGSPACCVRSHRSVAPAWLGISDSLASTLELSEALLTGETPV